MTELMEPSCAFSGVLGHGLLPALSKRAQPLLERIILTAPARRAELRHSSMVGGFWIGHDLQKAGDQEPMGLAHQSADVATEEKRRGAIERLERCGLGRH
jgi:hypothetical protein